jgi:flagellar biosynthetic protein FliR
MTLLLADLLDKGQMGLAVGFLVFLRVGAAMAVLPAFGERSIPERIRLALALAFTVVVTPAVAPQVLALLQSGPTLFLAMTAEAISGLALGISLRMFVLALQMAGSMAAQSTSLSQIFGGGIVDPQPAIGNVMVIGGLALAVITGLHVRLAEALIGSYSVFPAGVFPSPSALADWGLLRVAKAFALAFTLAAPFVIASFIYNVALGVINKAMPQLMVAMIGAPAISAGGLILLFLSLPLLLSIWSEGLNNFLANPFGAEN